MAPRSDLALLRGALLYIVKTLPGRNHGTNIYLLLDIGTVPVHSTETSPCHHVAMGTNN